MKGITVSGKERRAKTVAARAFMSLNACLCLKVSMRASEAFAPLRAQLARPDEPLKGFLDELFAFLDVIEDLALEREETAVNS